MNKNVIYIYKIIFSDFQLDYETHKVGKIFQVTDDTKTRKLPQHDFGTPEVYQTPSSFRFMKWKTETIQSKLLDIMCSGPSVCPYVAQG